MAYTDLTALQRAARNHPSESIRRNVARLAAFAVLSIASVHAGATPVTAGLELWLDAGSLSSGTSSVSSWADQSGNGRDAVASGAAGTAPSYIASNPLFADRASVSFDGGDFLTSSAASSMTITASNARTFFFVFSQDAAANRNIFGYGAESGLQLFDVAAAGQKISGHFLGTPFVNGTQTFALNQMTVGTASFDNGFFNTYQHDSTFSGQTSSSAYALNTTNSAFKIGGGIYSSYNDFNGDIAELLVYSGSMSDADRIAVDEYLFAKYTTEAPEVVAAGTTKEVSGTIDKAQKKAKVTNQGLIKPGASPGTQDYSAGLNLSAPSSVLESGSEVFAAISVYRVNESAPLSLHARQCFQRALPPIRQAVVQHREVERLRRHAALLETVLDRANKGAIVVDAQSRIMHANASARMTLESGSVLREDDGRLAAASSAGTAKLRSLVRDVCGHAATSATRRMETIRLHDVGAHDPIEILIESGSGQSVIGTTEIAPVLVFLNDPAIIDRTLVELFRGMFDLTPTEARLCGALARGLALYDAATELGCTISTVRSHLQRLFQETGTHRQAELLRRLGSIAALH